MRVSSALLGLLLPMTAAPHFFSPTPTPRDGPPTISDGIRSSSSSSSFFSSLDADKTGTLTPAELTEYIMQTAKLTTISPNMDDEGEVRQGVQDVMNRIDRHSDGSLSRSDFNEYLLGMELTMGVEQTRDWVKYAVQLPDRIADTFRENHVTGAEFMELIDNNGEAILTELNVPEARFRRKLVKFITLKLLGVGDVPQTVEGGEVSGEVGCDNVGIKWHGIERGGAIAKVVFPVHLYRVQRRVKKSNFAMEKNSKNKKSSRNDSSTLANMSVVVPYSRESSLNNPEKYRNNNPDNNYHDYPSSSAFKTVYANSEPEFVDEDLLPSSTYIYRIQAWNAVGHSSWSYLEVTTPPATGECAYLQDFMPGRKITGEDNTLWTNATKFMSRTYHFSNLVLTIVQVFFTFTALAAAVMRLQRGSTTSTGSANIVPLFPWLWRGVNSICLRFFGGEIFPQAMLTDVDALSKSKNGVDVTYGAVGLAGGEGSNVVGDGRVAKNEFTKFMDKRRKEMATPGAGEKQKKSRRFSFGVRRNSAKNRLDDGKTSNGSETEAGVDDENNNNILMTPKKSPGIRGRLGGSSYTKSPPGSLGSQDQTEGINESFYHDNSRCSVCEKKFKFVKRCKHTCSRCLTTFCHRHGRTSHSNLTSCKVPGSCVCDICLKVEEASAKKKGQERLR